MALPTALRAFRHRDYRLFYAGQGISQIGTWLQMIATSWLIFRLSESTFLLGLSAFALQAPFLVLGPLAGVFVDRMDRRHVLLATNCVAAMQAIAMLTVVALDVVEPWHLVAGNLVLGIVSACDAPARQSILIQLIGGRQDLPNAIALNSSMMNAARFVGPLAGGALIAGFGETSAFALNAASYLFMLAALWRIRAGGASRAVPQGSLFAQLLAGARYAFGFLPTRCALLLLAATSLTVHSYPSLMPWFAREVFRGDSGMLGVLVGAGGCGALTGMLYLATRPDLRGLLRLVGMMAALAGAALVAFAFARSLWIALPALYLAGMGAMLVAASTNTVLQSIVPDELRARVASLYVMSFLGMAPIGAFIAGWASERVGPPATLAACGGLALLASVAYAWQYPAIRRDIRAAYEKLGLVTGRA
ncbi:MAG TPA: MFS transporter [Burkholderiales bacterium]|nr:MFS transporter [Burkholderiales bacterium]